jgi:hypothetical protein
MNMDRLYLEVPEADEAEAQALGARRDEKIRALVHRLRAGAEGFLEMAAEGIPDGAGLDLPAGHPLPCHD